MPTRRPACLGCSDAAPADESIQLLPSQHDPDDQRQVKKLLLIPALIVSWLCERRLRDSQLLLQTTDVVQRVAAEKTILSEASELVAEKLVSTGVLSADKRDELKSRSLTSAFDEDILPTDSEASESADAKDEWDISNIE